MKRAEFELYLDDLGIDISQLSLIINDELTYENCSYGCYKKSEDKWTLYSYEERRGINEYKTLSEDSCFDYLKDKVGDMLSRRSVRGIYENDSYLLPRSQVLSFIKSEFHLTDKQAEENFEKLKQKMHLMMEFKYYIVEKKFIGSKYAYKIAGYTTEMIFNQTSLNVLGAFNYMLYLRSNREEALEQLKKGLLMRKIITNPEYIKEITF